MSNIGVGIIGSGFMGRTYAETISKYCKGAQLKAIAGGSRAEELAQDYSVSCEASKESLLARDDISCVLIATPHHAHAQCALDAATRQKHIMIEKPMACTVRQCDEIIEACEKARVYCSVAFTQRSRKCNIKAKQFIDEGALGKIGFIMEFQFLVGGLANFPEWQSDSANLGILFGHGIHNFDRIRWFTGAEIATVYAKCGTTEPAATVEGTSMLLMELTDGTAVSFCSSGQVPAPSFPEKQFSVQIIGGKGLIDLDAYGELRINTRDRWEIVEKQEPIDWAGKGFLDPVALESYAKHCQDFIGGITAGRQPPLTGWDGRQAVAAALAAYESSATGKIISLG